MRRKIDDLCRVAIPIEMMRTLGWDKGLYVDIKTEDGKVIITNYDRTNEMEFLRKRENKLQQIEQMFQNGIVDLSKLSALVKSKD